MTEPKGEWLDGGKTWVGEPTACPGADNPEERCPRHPNDCTCWQVDLDHPTVKNATTAGLVEAITDEQIAQVENSPNSLVFGNFIARIRSDATLITAQAAELETVKKERDEFERSLQEQCKATAAAHTKQAAQAERIKELEKANRKLHRRAQEAEGVRQSFEMTKAMWKKTLFSAPTYVNRSDEAPIDIWMSEKLWEINISVVQANARATTAEAECLRLREERDAALQGKTVIHGPYGWLNGPRNLNEENWELETDQNKNSEEYFSIPLYALIYPFKKKDAVDSMIDFILSDETPVGPEDQPNIDMFNRAIANAKDRLANGTVATPELKSEEESNG